MTVKQLRRGVVKNLAVFILDVSRQSVWYWPLQSLILCLLAEMNPNGRDSHLERTG